MSRQIAFVACFGAVVLLTGIGCGGRTGPLDDFNVGASGSAGAASGSAAGNSAGVTESGGFGASAESGTFVASGFFSSAGSAPGGSTTGASLVGGTGLFAGGTAGASVVGGTGLISGSAGRAGGTAGSATGSFAASGSNAAASGMTIDPGMIGGMLPPGAVMPGSISPQVAAGCDALCTKEAAAMCPNQGSLASCVVGCRLLLNNPACGSQTMSLFSCESTSAVSCDASGKAVLNSCPAQTLLSAACFLQSANDPALAGPCKSYCAGVAAAKCPNDDPSGCQIGCQVVGNLIPACNSAWSAYVRCADVAPLACGSNGKAWAPACLVQAFQYLACTAAGALTVADAGVMGGPPGLR